jgi:hypothetical protein
MSATEGKSKVPVFDSKSESFCHWEIQWNIFAEVEGIVAALGSKLYYKMSWNNTHYLDPAKDSETLMIAVSQPKNRVMA